MASKGNTNLKQLYTAWAAAFFGFLAVVGTSVIYVLYNSVIGTFSFMVVVISSLFLLSALILVGLIRFIDLKIKKVFGCNIKSIIDERSEQ